MDPFEKDLARALGRRQPPEEFRLRVLDRAGELDLRQPRRWNRPQRWNRWIAAAVVAALAAGMVAERAYRRHAEGERAREQVMLALYVTGSTLRQVQERVSGIDRPPPGTSDINGGQ